MHPDCSPLPSALTAPQAQAAPRIISCKMTDLQFTAPAPNGSRHLYVLSPESPRASLLPPDALIYVRIDPATPEHVEVFEPSTVYHKFLGPARPVADATE